ncbi:MAG: M56 family metallopeptidase [Pirellulales bacterium]
MVAAGIGLATHWFCKRRPHLAYVLWMVVLVKCLAPPLWSSPTGVFSWAAPGLATARPVERATAKQPNDVAAIPSPARADRTPKQEPARGQPLPRTSPDSARSSLEVRTADPAVMPGAVPTRITHLGAVLGMVWLAGAAVYAGLVSVTAAGCWRTIRYSQVPVDESLTALAAELGGRLGIRRSVRLSVISEPLGPMTYGWRRPTVVMPRALVASRSRDQLEPLLAHELVHVRRGDALIGLVQIIVQCLWWFHPLVWWANRRIAYERERCCDEEVVAGLAYQPGWYARSLVGVLHLKRQLRWLSALPGVRLFELTKRRLEHLMLHSDHFRTRMPRRYWLVLIAGVLMLAPGAGRSGGADGDAGDTTVIEAAPPAQESPLSVTRFVSPDGKRIAYGQIAVGPDGEQRVRIIIGNVDGTNRRPLPVDGEAVDEVRWYGNDRIAYVTDHGQDGYFLMDDNGKADGRITMPAGCDSFFHQCLSPDGRWIAFCGNYADVPSDVASEGARRRFLKEHPEIQVKHGLFAVDLKQQTVRHLLAETVANMPAWSADSKYLAAGIGHYVAHYPLAIINVETGEVQKPDVQGVGVAWSPDGSHLAMTTDVVRGGSWRGGVPMDGGLCVWDVPARQRTPVSPPGSNVSVKEPYSWVNGGSHGPVWSGDGEWIAYRRTEHARGAGRQAEHREEVWVVRRNGTGEKKVLNHGASELAWTADGRALLWVAEGRFGRIDLEMEAAALGPTPAAPVGAFTIQGRITDASGQPMEGVQVHVARGIGSLRSTYPVTSDADGRYEIHFGPGMFTEGANMQYACAFARKPGFYEKNLCRDGNLAMANFKPKNVRQADWGAAGIVYPGNPYRLDFTMLPAASISLELVDPDGAPLPHYKVALTGDDLYPASSVLAGAETDDHGRLEFESVPLKAYHFSLGSRRAEYKTQPILFDRAGPRRFRLVYDDTAGTLVATRR